MGLQLRGSGPVASLRYATSFKHGLSFTSILQREAQYQCPRRPPDTRAIKSGRVAFVGISGKSHPLIREGCYKEEGTGVYVP